MVRIKHVYPTSEIPRLWANMEIERAWNPQKNLSFEGKSIFSFGWYEIGRIVYSSRNEMGFLINFTKYSNTTARHVSKAHYAALDVMSTRFSERQVDSGNCPVFMVHLKHIPTMELHLKDYARRIDDSLKYAMRARADWHRGWKSRRAIHLMNEAKLFAKFFDLDSLPLRELSEKVELMKVSLILGDDDGIF